MKNRFAITIALISVLSLNFGCSDITTTLFVRKDGSGTITQETYVNKDMQEMMTGLSRNVSDDENALMKAWTNPERYKPKAASFGSGVEFLNAQVGSKASYQGAIVTYSFSDITKIRLSEIQSVGTSAMSADPNERPISFGFSTEGDQSVLTVMIPQPEYDDLDTIRKKAADGASSIKDSDVASMDKQFNGWNLRMLVKVSADIKETNARYVDAGSSVILHDVNLGKLFSNKGDFKRLMGLGELGNTATAKNKLRIIDGVKIETNSAVTIKF